jgi:hypothetical protein
MKIIILACPAATDKSQDISGMFLEGETEDPRNRLVRLQKHVTMNVRGLQISPGFKLSILSDTYFTFL